MAVVWPIDFRDRKNETSKNWGGWAKMEAGPLRPGFKYQFCFSAADDHKQLHSHPPHLRKQVDKAGKKRQ